MWRNFDKGQQLALPILIGFIVHSEAIAACKSSKLNLFLLCESSIRVMHQESIFLEMIPVNCSSSVFLLENLIANRRQFIFAK
ncbi:MAG: hypothetical protein C6W58_17180 [Bacillaceae bacterium]|jgi:hypothetical protein|uniref:Uncharacterized protein n=1 Tax=Aeribacillus pallidus TaxID=33936 RepID=A0A163Y9K4_9BACI|nr:hypothetical protein A3Q35_02850 [Aeribacillus pallidus]KZN95327.1 hypothetical protein AZI98_15120 [Aeribacillus pallidus]REJ12163.1 MAG: hypothetical protein C6W58_17180 [Bacillaceae bacterium]